MKILTPSVTRAFHRKVLQAKQKSPHIFFVGGVVGVGVSTVMACRATLKLESTLDEIKEDVDAVKSMGESSRNGGKGYHKEEYYKDLGYVYGKAGAKLGKLYGPSLSVGVVSIAALTGSHIQMTKRNTALAATLAAVNRAFDEYRDRVREELGEERENDIYRAYTVVEADVDGKKQEVKVRDPNAFSLYAKIFDPSNQNWKKNAEYNRMFLQCQQNYFNHRLHAYGHVFLNEVYDSLGLERTRAGQVVGWVLDGPNSDNHIDFGIFEPENADFVNGFEPCIWLDFNVDGVITELF